MKVKSSSVKDSEILNCKKFEWCFRHFLATEYLENWIFFFLRWKGIPGPVTQTSCFKQGRQIRILLPLFCLKKKTDPNFEMLWCKELREKSQYDGQCAPY
jgi:hypothetical protein